MTTTRFNIIILIIAINAVCIYGYQFSLNPYPRLELSGNHSLSVNVNSVTGSQRYFADDNFGRNKQIVNQSNLYLRGDLWRDLSINASLSISPYAPDNIRWTLKYNGSNAKVTVGEFSAGISGNEFVSINRMLKGIQVDPVFKKGTMSVINSKIQAPVRTDTLYGRNVSGPYYLSSAPVIPESEVVLINDVKKTRGLDKDYIVDYTNGTIDFAPDIIVGPADIITVSYEVQTTGLGGGTLTAMRASYPLNKSGTSNIGLNYIQLKGRSSSVNIRDERDQYYGNGLPGPFYLTWRPIIASTETVTINGSLQARNTAYTIDYNTGTVTFKIGFEPQINSLVVVRYQVSSATFSGSDKNIAGIDLSVPVAKGVKVTMQVATSTPQPPKVVEPARITDEAIYLAFGVPSGGQQFNLKKSPVRAGSELIRYSTGTLIKDTDYTINYATGQIMIIKNDIPALPTGASLYVSYTTDGSTTYYPGDSAVSVSTNLQRDSLAAHLTYKYIDPGFSPLESAGYKNLRRQTDWNATYSALSNLSFSTTGLSSLQPYLPYGNNSSNIFMANKTNNHNIRWQPFTSTIVIYQHNDSSTQQKNDTRIGTNSIGDEFRSSVSFGQFNAGVSFRQSNNESRQVRTNTDSFSTLPTTTSSTDTVYRYSADTTAKSANMQWIPGDRFNAGANFTINNIKSLNGDNALNTDGKNMAFNTKYLITPALTLTSSYTKNSTDAGKTAGGADTPKQITSSITNSADWRATENLSITASASFDENVGGVYSNSKTDNLNSSINWQPLPRISLNGYINNQKLHYIPDNTGNTVSTTYGISSDLYPFSPVLDGSVQRVSYRPYFSLDTQQMTSTANINNSYTENKMSSYSAKMTMPFSTKNDLFYSTEFVQMTGFPSKSNRDTQSLGWNYHASEQMTVTINLQRITYRDQTSPSLNYSANSLQGQINLHF
ncbi:MAG: hypothetical protein WCO98_04690 [bacterium]